MTETTRPDGLRSVEGLTEWLRAAVAARVRRDPAEIGGGEHFSSYGLDSLRAASVITALSDALGRRVSPALLWAYPTVDALAAHLLATPNARTTRCREGPADPPAASRRREPIAVVGLACRFPKAGDPEEFWQLLRTGTDAVGVVPAQRWDVDGFVDPDPPDPTAVAKTVPGQAGFLDQPLDEFDALFFGISPREAEEMDPQQRLFLEVAWEALEEAGLANEALRGSRTGVFAGAIWHDYADLAGGDLQRLSPYSATGRALNMVANRLSYVLDLRGPSVVVDSACSSSLLAIHLACQSLWSGESSTAIAGGVNLLLNPAVMVALSKFGGLSPDGRCKAFDARADGFGRGEGVGVVVLKPLSRALADDDDIWCTIRASATNNDGFSNGLTAPNPLAQEDVLREAYRRGGVTPADVHYVETHGTGTQLGDPIEAAALGAVFADGRPTEAPLLIGSVKTNLGHLEGAAGIAGLIKTALCLRHRQVAPNVHFETPNPHIAFDEVRLRVPRELEPWPQDRPLLAGVSSFGWGGTNVHVVLEGWREPTPLPAPRPTGSDPGEVGDRPRIAFVCSPHGHQWVGMGRQMYRTEPVFRAALDQCDRELAHHTGWSVIDELFLDGADAHTEDVDVVQPVLFAIQVALAAWLESSGVVPGAVVGHSLGEIAAAVIAGILNLPDAARLVHHYSRQQRIVADQGGGMAIVELPAAELEALLSDRRLPLVVAARNGPASTALAGELPALEGVLAELKARDVLCGLIRVNVAAHSPAIDPVMVELERVTEGLTPRPGRIPMISTVTGSPVRWQDLGPGYFARNLRQPVHLDEAMGILLSDRWDAVLEISAHPVLLSALQQCVDESGRAVTLFGTMRRGEDDRSGPADTLAAIAELGALRAAPERSELVTLSAKTPQALSAVAERVAASIDAATAPPAVRDVARAAAHRADQPYRLAVVARAAGEFSTALRAYAHGDVPVGLRVSEYAAETPPGVAFVFPGQGSQWLGMGRELLAHDPVFHTAIRECDGAAREFVDWSILAELEADEETSHLGRIDVAQPVLFAVQVALAALWRSWGVEPIAVVGHSMGEVAAAYVAGALRIEDAARIICLRSRLLRRVSGAGAMLAVELPPDEAQRALAGHEDSVSVAVHNGPRSTVLSGDRHALTQIAERLERDEVFCRWVKVDVASHSPQMDALSADLRSAIDGLAPQTGTVPLHSTVTGGVVDGADLDEQYWIRNLREPVLFSDQVTRLVRAGVRAFVEISPHPILLPAVEQVTAHVGSDAVTLPSLRRHEPDRDTLLASLGQLYVLGTPIASSSVHTPGRRGIRLPTYPWQRERYWLDERSDAGLSPKNGSPGSRGHGLLGERLDPAMHPGTHCWQLGIEADTASVRDHRVGGSAVVPGALYVEMALQAAGEVYPGGHRVTVSDLIFRKPLVVPDRGRLRGQVVLTESEPEGCLRFFAERDGAMHCVAEATVAEREVCAKPALLDLAALEGRMTEAVEGSDYYHALAARGLDYGPAFRCIERIARTDVEALARLELPAVWRSDDVAYHVHPALLDAALQAAVAPLLGPGWGAQQRRAFLSEGIARVLVHQRAGTGAWAHAVLRRCRDDERCHEADVQVASPDGELLLEVIGVRIVRSQHLPGPAAPGAETHRPAAGKEPGAGSIRDALAALPAGPELRRAIEAAVRDSVAQVVKLAPGRIAADRPLRGLGIDSIMSLELRNRLEAKFGVRLSATLIWNHPTIREIAPFLAGKLGLALDDHVVPAPTPPTEPGPLVPAGGLGPVDPQGLLERELAELTRRLEDL